MSGGRKAASFLAVLLLVACGMFLAFQTQVRECVSVLRNGWGRAEYLSVSVNQEGAVCLVSREDGKLRLVFSDLQGKKRESWTAGVPQEALEGGVAAVYPIAEDSALLAVYEENAQYLTVYAVDSAGGAERLLRETCSGSSGMERRENTRLSGFSQAGEQVCFVLLTADGVRSYAYQPGSAGLEALGSGEDGQWRSAVVLSDGTLALGGDGALVLAGEQSAGVPASHKISSLTWAESGFYYVDSASLDTFYSDPAGSSVRRVLDLSQSIGEHVLTDLAVAADGSVLLLLDGHALSLVRSGSVTDLTELLYPRAQAGALILAVIAVGTLLLSALLWYLLCGARRGRMPLALFWGCVLLSLAVAASLLVEYGLVAQSAARTALEQDTAAAESVVRLALADSPIQADSLPQKLCGVFESLSDGSYTDVTVVAARESGGVWTLSQGDLAQTAAGFDPALARQAKEQGSAVKSGDKVWYCLSKGAWTLTVSMRRAPQEQGSLLARGVLAAIALVTVAGIVILLLISRDVRRLAKGMERISNGTGLGRFRIRSGDELEGMSSTLGSLSAALEEQERKRDQLVQSYRRFVPERVLGLLGKQSILEVDKSTVSVRRMAVMMVWFTFPEWMSADGGNSRLLFDSFNQVIERTASIANERGGTVFNFAYDGYDVVLEENPEQVVSTAVAIEQEVLAFNEQRERDGLPAVTFRIALDVGDVLLGVVGDSRQMEPTTISSSFSVVKTLIGLCGRLEANILCTEEMIAGAQGYGNRYLGKCYQGGRPIRVYEIFDGDPYGVRRGKAVTVRSFSQGVLALYSGDLAQAKRIFLELAHDHPEDGGARYYLYLADQMEHHPEQRCGLDV